MPAKNRVRLYNTADFGQQSSPEHLGLGCKSASLVIIQPHALLAELLSQNSVLLPKIVDRACCCLHIQAATSTANSGHGAIRIQPAYLWPGLPISAVHSLPTVPHHLGTRQFTVRPKNETIPRHEFSFFSCGTQAPAAGAIRGMQIAGSFSTEEPHDLGDGEGDAECDCQRHQRAEKRPFEALGFLPHGIDRRCAGVVQ